MLALLADVTSPDPAADAALVARELEEYSAALARKPRVLVLTKADLLSPEDRERAAGRAREGGAVLISAHTGEGVPGLLEELWRRLAPTGDEEGE